MNRPWSPAKLYEILTPISRAERIEPMKTYRLLGVRLEGAGPFHRETIMGSQSAATTLYEVKSGDFIYSRLFACRGAFGVIGSDLDGCYVSGEFPTFIPVHDKVDVNFLRLWFRLSTTIREVDANCTGSTPLTRNRFKENFFLNLEIQLPPLGEQRRIVAKIQELAAKIGEARGLRQQTIEDAWTLLESTRVNIFKKMSSSWKVQKLDEVAPINMGQSPPGESYNTFGDGIPLLNGPTEFGEKYPTPVQWTTAPTKLCKPGDILLCVRGATTGRLNWADKEYCIGRGLAALTPNPKVCVPEYVYHFVETQTQEMLGLAAGSTFPNLPGAKLKVLEISIPPVPQQRRVVAYLDSLEANVEGLKQLQKQTAAELDALLPSILDKAFKGEL